MSGRRVFISGLGGELGTLVASLLEAEPWVGELAGIDADPPRRRLQRTTYHRISPDAHDRIVDTVIDFDPHVLVHMAVWEPNARAAGKLAAQFTDQAAISIIGAAAECPSLEHIVVRSGIEAYGRGRGSRTRPDEASPLRPTTPWGESVAGIERTAAAVSARIGVPVGTLRLAPVLGPHAPSPLGRMLRQPIVPFHAFVDPPFAVVEDRDAARAFVAAARIGLAEPVNVVAAESVTSYQAARSGSRLPLPITGPQWPGTRLLSYVTGAPIPEHVLELLRRGRLADGSRMRELLGVGCDTATPDVIDKLYGWPSVVRRPARRQVA